MSSGRPDQEPPITEGQLVGLFQAARPRTGAFPLMTEATAANAAVGEALDAVLDAARLDDHTRRQLKHVFDALKSIIARTVVQPETADVLDAVEEALANVEKAFDRRPPRHLVPAPPWYQDDRRLEVIQDLMGEASRKNEEETWIAVGRLRGLLHLEGVQILSYRPEDGAERQADAFSIEDYAEGRPNGRFVTDVPAIVKPGTEGTRQILIRGRVLRLPAEDAE